MSLGFYVALWAQIGLGVVIYLFGIQEPRVLLTLSAVLNAAAMMMSFVFIYFLNKGALRKRLHAGILRVAMMALAFAFFAYFLVSTMVSSL